MHLHCMDYNVIHPCRSVLQAAIRDHKRTRAILHHHVVIFNQYTVLQEAYMASVNTNLR